MEINTIVGVGFVVMRSEAPGYLAMRTWVRSSSNPGSLEESYDHLTRLEVLDVIDQVLASKEPGYQLLDGCWQPGLF